MCAQSSNYEKQFRSFDEQVALLEKRGLLISDKIAVRRFLAATNYYRFTGYAIPFLRDNDRENFKAGVTFEQICHVISFDNALRNFVAQALRAIEIDFRTTVAHEHSRCYGAMGYTSKGNFARPDDHDYMRGEIDYDIRKSTERCIVHFRHRYNGNVPIWAVIEVVSFGKVSHLYKAMKGLDQMQVARRYGLHQMTLSSYIHHLSVVRNACAHHARLWDKEFRVGRNGDGFLPLAEWSRAGISARDTCFLFHTLALIYRMARPIPKSCFDRDAWKDELIGLLEAQRQTPLCDADKEMGIPKNWTDGFWWV